MLMALLVYVLGMPLGVIMAWIGLQMMIHQRFLRFVKIMYPWPEYYLHGITPPFGGKNVILLDLSNNKTLSEGEQKKRVTAYVTLSILFWPICLVWIAFFALFFYPFVWVIKTLCRIGAFVYNKLILPALLPLARFLAS